MSNVFKTAKPEGWYCADLHVHTPASKDYAGLKASDEYKKIIARACSDVSGQEETAFDLPRTKLNLIAITDHNSVDGYKELMKIRQETLDLLQKVKERSPDCDLVKTLEDEVKIFNSVHVLMGVEVSPDPGIHLLLIFKENVGVNEVEAFLEDGFGGNYSSVKGTTEGNLRWNIDQTMDRLREVFGDRAFVVAPHADSNKGLFESLKNLPQPRMRAFRHEILKAVSFNNPDNRDRMEQMLKSTDYQRSSPLSFIQSSDYHGQTNNDIGTLFAKVFLGTKKVSFSSLAEALSVKENVICSVDINREIYDELVDGFPITKFVSSSNAKIEISESDYRNIADTACAYLNSDGGIIEISASNVNYEDRVAASKDYKDNILKIINQKVKPSIPDITIKQLPMSNTRLCVLAYFKSSARLHSSDGRIYFLNNDEIKEADISEVEYIVAKNLERRIGKGNQADLEGISLEATRLSRTYSSYPIVIKCDRHLKMGLSASFKVKYFKSQAFDDKFDTLMEGRTNGYSSGNLTCTPGEMQEPRLEDGYLRFSSPLWNAEQSDIDDLDKTENQSLIVTLGGGVFSVGENTYIYSRNHAALLIPEDSNFYFQYLAWFKSSFFIWYNSIIIGSEDLFRQVLVGQSAIPLPNETFLISITEAGHLARQVIDHENTFLDILNDAINTNKDIHDGLVLDFNKQMNDLNLEIDNYIMSALGLNQSEIDEIYDALNSINIYTFDKGKQ